MYCTDSNYIKKEFSGRICLSKCSMFFSLGLSSFEDFYREFKRIYEKHKYLPFKKTPYKATIVL